MKIRKLYIQYLFSILVYVVESSNINDHLYHENNSNTNTTVRKYVLHETHPKTALLCPKGFAISRITMILNLHDDIMKESAGKGYEIPYAHWILKEPDIDGVQSDEENGFTRCPTLKRCLGYQACLFKFGNEFCNMDPSPGQRKNLRLNITCTRDSQFLNSMKRAEYSEGDINKVHRSMNKVLHMTYISQLEEGIMEYDSTVITEREADEDQVFHGSCPLLNDAKAVGYRGICIDSPPDPVEVSEGLWGLLGRVPDEQCRMEIQQIYCSFLYQRKGLCLPPYAVDKGQDMHILPEHLSLSYASMNRPGPRPSSTVHQVLNNQPHQDLVPVRIGFLILAHKDPHSLMQLLQLIYRPFHFYVIHIEARRSDTRIKIQNLIKENLPTADNVRVLHF